MKRILVLILFASVFFNANAQMAFDKGNVGINLGAGIVYDINVYPSLNLSVEYGAIPIKKAGVISFGGGLNTFFWDGRAYTGLNFRAAFHLGFLNTSKFDVYGGLAAGFGLYTGAEFDPNVFIGARIMFGSKFGIFAETGAGMYARGKFGICWIL